MGRTPGTPMGRTPGTPMGRTPGTPMGRTPGTPSTGKRGNTPKTRGSNVGGLGDTIRPNTRG